MDPALLKQRETFLKRAQAQPSVSTKGGHLEASGSNDDQKRKAHQPKRKKHGDMPTGNSKALLASFDYKTASTNSTTTNFGALVKIVDYMKKRHLNNQTWPLSVKEILNELQIYDLSKRTELWLAEVMPSNRRLSVDSDQKFAFKPPYRIKPKAPMASLLNVLKKMDMEGKGGVLLSDLNECVKDAEGVAQGLKDAVIELPTQVNKRKDRVYFYNDPDSEFKVDEDFQELWRNVNVDHLDERRIEEYLQKHGIDSMRDLAPKKANLGGVPKRKQRKRGNYREQNEHLSGVLEDYADE